MSWQIIDYGPQVWQLYQNENLELFLSVRCQKGFMDFTTLLQLSPQECLEYKALGRVAVDYLGQKVAYWSSEYTKKTELLFLALFLRLLKPGGRAAVIVPDGVLFGSSNAHKTLRQLLVEEQKLEGVVALPGGVFKPYAGVSTAILLFTKTNSGGTDNVWFYKVKADGMSLDDKRTPLLPQDKFGVAPQTPLAEEDHPKNNLPDILKRWAQREDSELDNPRTAQSFCVPKADIAAQGYDLSLNRYREVVHEEVEHRKPRDILEALGLLEEEIRQGMLELEGMLK